MSSIDFDAAFCALSGSPPFPWQQKLYQAFVDGEIPSSCNLPTGLGKTSVIHIWLLALAQTPDKVPRRLVYVVNRRTVVDQATDETRKLRERIALVPGLSQRLRSLCAGMGKDIPLAISTLRGQFADNREWCSDPARPAVVVGTVDMIGSRLLFSGYGCGFKSRPLHAGFLGQDTLLVHDEAHLEPAFQKLIEAIREEQRREPAPFGERQRLRVMELTATSRTDGPPPFRLSEEDEANPVVRQRLFASKGIAFHEVADEKRTADKLTELALAHKESNQAILVFASLLDTVNRVAEQLRKEFKKERTPRVQLLTGTRRGYERDRLASHDPIFARFLPEANRPQGVTPQPGTVYLVCTSAGEVGVNISADHLACDLTTFESMAQRFGRVNRFGSGDARIDIVCPSEFDTNGKPREAAREQTLALLRELPERSDGLRDASPHALQLLPDDRRQAAFSPEPEVLPTSDILFDAWALTSIRESLPGRPAVEEYLHGVSEGEPPETHVAWREEVEVLEGVGFTRKQLADLLDDYPLKPHELLRDATYRVRDSLAEISVGKEHLPVWLVTQDGEVTPLTVGQLLERKPGARKSEYLVEIAYRTVVLPPSAGGLTQAGILGIGDPAPKLDVADEWWDENGRRRRVRIWDHDSTPEDAASMRLVQMIDTQPDAEDEANEEPGGRRFWSWYVRPRSADEGGASSATREQLLDRHLTDTEGIAVAVAGKLLTDARLRTAVRLAARWHDLGKRRELWQRNMGNSQYPGKVIAKTGHTKPPKEWIDYRHEFGSLLDILDEEQTLRKEFDPEPEEVRELILHLIAAHHGRGRPHFSADEMVDPDHSDAQASAVARDVPRRFARLQREYGRWGLAWLESLLRAADAEASANPREVLRG